MKDEDYIRIIQRAKAIVDEAVPYANGIARGPLIAVIVKDILEQQRVFNQK